MLASEDMVGSMCHSKCTDSAEQLYEGRSAWLTTLPALLYSILSLQFYYSVHFFFKLVWVSNEQFHEGNLAYFNKAEAPGQHDANE